jgi:type VI secretion system Hcp family effector
MPIYLRLDQIQGEVTSENYVGQIELFSFSHGLSYPPSTTDGASVGEINVTKTTDRASAPLIAAALAAEVLGQATITFARTDGALIVPYLVIDLTNARVTSLATSSDGDRPMEQLSLVSERITWTYKPGTKEAVTFGYDLPSAKPLP